ncbi:MAG: hypothetical protein KAI43_14630 [Candidatus Aureabacteria bacterium]|nr:hypothetical protein [Candidatus Auribacterota bacterium]
MELTQKYPLDFLGKYKLTALEDKIICEYKSLTTEYNHEFLYSDIKPTYYKAKAGDQKWFTVALIIFAIGFASALILKSFHTLSFFLFSITIGLSIIAVIRAFIKREFITFYTKDNFSIPILLHKSDMPQNNEMADFIISKIESIKKKETI